MSFHILANSWIQFWHSSGTAHLVLAQFWHGRESAREPPAKPCQAVGYVVGPSYGHLVQCILFWANIFSFGTTDISCQN